MRYLTKLIIALGLAVGPTLAFSGDMTYFDPGLGSCGWTNTNNDAIVALSESQPGNCGKNIRIHYNGKTTTAKVVDACPGCGSGSIDVSRSVFGKLADLDKGRVKVTWEFI
ncbi:RlpA-like double-psi beta-barrel-protein domain-containing protein-containing protein [Nemania abortiva]|nr:RlpA-like double-psi beta-barrel-protein domain-containing protein-containing protein [Nemania abortiva]